ncbi:ABC transporter permease [Paenibacillus chitinolyticus]|uniref:ABC transporter permease n=1 Tax=Paenibacillus chitinolyticus TaxID=79263 RepID=UPI003D03E7C7
MKLLSKLIRDIKQSSGQFIALVLVVAVGAFFYGGLVSYSDTLRTYTTDYFKSHHLSDLYVYYKQLTKEEAARLSEIEGVHKLEGRYTLKAKQVFDNVKTSLTVHSIPANNEINTLTIVEGSIPSKKGEIVVDSHYAAEHQYRTGDTIRIYTDGKEFTFTISGLCENVEYAKKNRTQDHKAQGFAYISEETVPDMLGGEFTYNEIMIDAEEGYDVDQIGKSIEAQSSSLAYLNQVNKERTFNYSQITQTIYNNTMMSKVIPLVLFLIEAIIVFLIMSRLIDSQRNQVGIMKALGVKSRSILLHYMGYPVLVSIVGSILGCAIAALVFIPMVRGSSARSYSLPDITFSLSLLTLIPPILFSGAFGSLACYLSGRNVLKERAAQAMRPKPPKKMKKLIIEKIPGIWNRIPYSYKLIFRNLFLNKQKALASSVGVVVSTVLLITAFGTQTALQKVASQAEDVHTYDLRVDYSAGPIPNPADLPSGIKNRVGLATFPIEFIKDDGRENATLVVTEKENSLLHFFDDQDNRISLEEGGVLVPKSYADKYHLAKGDTIQLKFADPELKNKSVDMKVSHISTQYSNPSFYITPAYLKSFDLDYRPASLLIEAAGPADLASIRHFFEQDPRVDTLTDKSDLKKSAQYILKQNSFVFILFIICAVLLSFGAIYTITSINIYERNRELATLKVLGYQKSKINRLIFVENIILTTFAVLAALPISGYVYSLVVKALSSTHQQIPNQLNPFVMSLAIIAAYLLTLLSNLLLRRKITRINMIESLKSVE